MITLAPEYIFIAGTMAEWQEWTGLRFPESGRYVVQGALPLVDLDPDADRGIHYDPNAWMKHEVRR